MIRISMWSGLVSAASPYALPAGGAVEQVNAMSHIPGQLTVRGGMNSLKHVEDEEEGPVDTEVVGGIIEMWGYSVGENDPTKLFLFTDAGNLIVLNKPQVA